MISICGMGGLLMSEILDAHLDYVEDKILFLQANTAIDLLREYLMNHNLQIIDEALVKDAHHIYEIMVVKKGHQELDEKIFSLDQSLENRRILSLLRSGKEN